jgi:chemotaxis response regulator CheB
MRIYCTQLPVQPASRKTQQRHTDIFHYILLQAAGGVEALSILVSTLPTDFPAPLVLAQHLDPSRPSALDLILQKRTTLPVEVVKSHTTLENGKIYVVIHTFEPESQRIHEGQQEGYFSYTIIPSHNASGRVNGVSIYTTNETEQHA